MCCANRNRIQRLCEKAQGSIVVPVDCMPAVVDSLISISSLPVITMSATTSDACEDVGDVVISSKMFVCKLIRKEKIMLPITYKKWLCAFNRFYAFSQNKAMRCCSLRTDRFFSNQFNVNVSRFLYFCSLA